MVKSQPRIRGRIPDRLRSVRQRPIHDFEYMKRTEPWGILTYTMHPFVIGRGHRMMMLEGLISALRERGARFVTMEDAALAFRDRAKAG